MLIFLPAYDMMQITQKVKAELEHRFIEQLVKTSLSDWKQTETGKSAEKPEGYDESDTTQPR